MSRNIATIVTITLALASASAAASDLAPHGAAAADAVFRAPGSAHCECLAAVGREYDPEEVVSDGNTRTLEVERRAVFTDWATRRYARCMTERGANADPNPFPYGLSPYHDGPEFHPKGCAASG